MLPRFAVVDEETGLVAATCDDILGLSGEFLASINGEECRRLILRNWLPVDVLKLPGKRTPGLLSIAVIDNQGNILGTYYFFCESKARWKDRFLVPCQELELLGALYETPSQRELELWDTWRRSRPIMKNTWADLSEEDRRAWLSIVVHHDSVHPNSSCPPPNGTYHLDGAFVVDYPSFFIALGEALNGPGGYYGRSLYSMKDAFCGGFGPVPPFSLRWSSSQVAIDNLTQEAWLRNEEALRKLYGGKDEDDESLVTECVDRALMPAILDTFAEQGVRVILE